MLPLLIVIICTIRQSESTHRSNRDTNWSPSIRIAYGCLVQTCSYFLLVVWSANVQDDRSIIEKRNCKNWVTLFQSLKEVWCLASGFVFLSDCLLDYTTSCRASEFCRCHMRLMWVHPCLYCIVKIDVDLSSNPLNPVQLCVRKVTDESGRAVKTMLVAVFPWKKSVA